jgi:renalase
MPAMGESHSTEAPPDCLIVGAGIAGLLAANVLAEAGLRVRVLEKGRGLGGRMATRRRDEAVFDHGAQFFTVRDARFEFWVAKWRQRGLVEPWYAFGEKGTHYRGNPGMNAIGKHLAEGLDVRRSCEVRGLHHAEGSWSVFGDEGPIARAGALLLAAPVPQSLALLESGAIGLPEDALKRLRGIRYRRCIAALAILERPSALAANGGSIKLAGEPIQWMADNQRKGISPDVPAVTIHSTPAFADANWDVPDELRIPKLLEAAAPYLQAPVVSWEGHRWGFSEPVGNFGREAFVDPGRRLAIAGDGLTGGRIEGAALSGLAAARELLEMIPAAI